MTSTVEKKKNSVRRRKHYRIKNKFRFITFVTVCALCFSFAINGLFGLGSVAAADKQEFVTIRVEEGDTLWALAKQYGPQNVDCRKVIYQIEKLNDVSASTLQVGAYITIPTNYI